MSESYTVSGRLMMTSNVPEVLAQMVRGFEEADKLINGMRETVGRLTTDFRELSEAGRGGRGGLSGLLKQLEKLGTAKIGGTIISDMGRMRETLEGAATAQVEMAKGAMETARAWREIAAAGGGRGGRGGRRGGGAGSDEPGSPDGWNPASRLAYPNAQWGNANENAKDATRGRLYGDDYALANRQNADGDARYARDRGLADHEQASRNAMFDRDYALANRENNDMLARDRAANRSVNQRHGHGMDAALGAQMGGDAGVGLMEKGFHAYGEVQTNQITAQSDLRVTDAVLAQANKLIGDLQKVYPALTQAEGLTLFRNTMGIFGNAGESMEALPGAVKLQQLYQLSPGSRGGTGGSEVQAAEKAGDAMQSFIDPKTGALDRKLYDQWMDFQARSYTAGGGLVDAKGWLAFARTSRSAGISLSPHALEETQALLEMSPGRTGTALMSAFQVFGASTHHMTQKNAHQWTNAGLIDKKGNLVDKELYQKDPFEWVWKDMLPRLQKMGVDSREKILAWLTDNGQRGTVAGILSDIAIGRTPITNTATKMESQDPNTVDKLVNSDLGRLAALHAAETNFFVALGRFGEGPGLTVLSRLTDGLNAMATFATNHPKLATDLITIGGGGAIFAKVAGDLAMTIYLGAPLVKGMAALATSVLPFGKGGVAAAALETLTSRSGLLGIAMGIEALGAATGKFPAWLVHGLSGAAVGGAIAGAPGAIVGGLGGSFYGAIQQGPRAGATLGDDPMEMLPGGFTKESYTTRSGGGLKATNAAYLQPANNNRPIITHVVFKADMREIARGTIVHMDRAASRDPSGITGFDPRQTMTPPGQIHV
jgi:hypothetical protein